MRVTVIGSGYVGLVTGACLSDLGFKVVCLDKDLDKIKMLQEGDVPIYEPGLKELLARNYAEGRIRYTTNAAEAIDHGDVLFIAVGTPPLEDGSADLATNAHDWLQYEEFQIDREQINRAGWHSRPCARCDHA